MKVSQQFIIRQPKKYCAYDCFHGNGPCGKKKLLQEPGFNTGNPKTTKHVSGHNYNNYLDYSYMYLYRCREYKILNI